MSYSTIVGMDTSKNVFEICEGTRSRITLRKRVYRKDVLAFFAQHEPCLVAMEAGPGSHYWGRELQKLGHEVRLIAPQFVKPYVKSNKSDRIDAAAIREAVQRPEMRFVAVKSVEQQELQHLHRARSQVYKQLTAINNEVRGMLAEFGVVIARGKKAARQIPEKLDALQDVLGSVGLQILRELYEELLRLEARIAELDRLVDILCKSHPVCRRLDAIPGIGATIATAVVAAAPDPGLFKNGRQFAAFLGLVPRHAGTGGRNRPGRISKRGDGYLRMQLVHGARSLLYRAGQKSDRMSVWAEALKKRRGWNKAAVALANKNARIIWSLLRHETEYVAAA